MKILFVQNFGINESLSVADLSALLKSQGNSCDLLIENNENNLFAAVKIISPDIFIIPWDIGTCSWTTKMGGILKKYFGKPVVYCGTYPSFYPDKAIGYPDVEIICMGEPEYALQELTQKLEKKEEVTGIRNLWVKKDGRVYRNEFRPLIDNLDSLPLPDRGLYFRRYKYLRDISLKRFTSGRGCPNSCRFCYNPLFRQRYADKGVYVRRKSVTRIIQEIEDVRRISVLKSVHFSDDLFTIDKDWLRRFCSEYQEKIKLPFTCNATVETIDDEIVKTLKLAGCSGMAMGIESGNQEYRNFILHKKISNYEIIEAARLIKKHGLFLTTFNIIALPGEEIDNVFETMKLNAKIKADNIRLTFASPLPGTELALYGLEKGFFDKQEIENLLDNTLYPTNALIKSAYKNQFENLFYVFRFGVCFPMLIPFIRKMRKVFLIRIFSFLNMLVNIYCERRFFNVTWFSGVKYMLHSGTLDKRTKVFNNFMP